MLYTITMQCQYVDFTTTDNYSTNSRRLFQPLLVINFISSRMNGIDYYICVRMFYLFLLPKFKTSIKLIDLLICVVR